MHCLRPAIAALLVAAAPLPAAETFTADLVVYGPTSAGVIAAVQAKKLGKSVIVVGPDKHMGFVLLKCPQNRECHLILSGIRLQITLFIVVC